MVKLLTDWLDALGLLLMAAGAAAATYQFMGWSCLAVAGVVVLIGSGLAARLNEPKDKNEPLP